MARLVAAVLLVILAESGRPSAAEQAPADCNLGRIAELPTIDNEYDSPIVSTLLDGQPRRMLVDTGGFWSMIRPDLGDKYRPKSLGVTAMLGLRGLPMTKVARIPDLQLGVVKFSYGEFFISPSGYMQQEDGTLGANWLSMMDVEIDPISKKVSMFSQDHCAGAVMYWPHEDEAVLPLDIDRHENLITIPIKLNGTEIRALIDTGAPETVLSASVAERLFDLTPASPGAEKAPDASKATGDDQSSFRYQFNGLEFENITIKHPWLLVTPMNRLGPDMIIGMNHLSGLHLYFAYREKKLYVSSSKGDIVARRAKGDDLAGIVDPMMKTNARDHLYMATLALQGKKLDDAAAEIANALALYPDYGKALLLRADLHWRKGERDQSNADIARAIHLAPQDPWAYAARLSILQAEGNYDGAFADAEEMVKLLPNSAMALNNRCWLGAIIGKLDAALMDCNAALAIDPHAAATLDSRAFVHLKAGRSSEAIADYDSALKINPKLASSLYGRGLAKRQKGDQAGGDADITAAIARDKDIAEHFGK